MFGSRFGPLMATRLAGSRSPTKADKAPSRRAFLRALMATFAAAQLDPLFRAILHDRTLMAEAAELSGDAITDRKSTRLNSSHPSISYAVFCLKKKKKNKTYSNL